MRKKDFPFVISYFSFFIAELRFKIPATTLLSAAASYCSCLLLLLLLLGFK
jgi:hypothetical protein